MSRYHSFAIFPACALGLSLAITPVQAAAPSFSCAKAKRPDEVAICHSPALSMLDQRMSSLYLDITACSGMGVRGEMQDDQRVWLKARHACKANTACVTKLYTKLINEWEPRAAPYRAGIKAGDCPI